MCCQDDIRERYQWGDGRRNLHLFDPSRYVSLVQKGSSTHSFVSLDQVAAGTVDESVIDEAVATLLRAKFVLGLFESKATF